MGMRLVHESWPQERLHPGNIKDNGKKQFSCRLKGKIAKDRAG